MFLYFTYYHNAVYFIAFGIKSQAFFSIFISNIIHNNILPYSVTKPFKLSLCKKPNQSRKSFNFLLLLG